MNKPLFYSILILTFLFRDVSAQTPEELRSWLPEVPGWSISEKVEIFTPDNLFDRINGSAPLFIENNFREMTSVEYTRGDDYITIQAYRHATPQDAFGMYASERSSGLNQYPFGGEAQGDKNSMYFFAGNIYVKMWTSTSTDVSDALRTIAKGFAEKIDPDADYPKGLLEFRKEGKVPYSEAYITANYLGHEFLRNVYTMQYLWDEKPYQGFLILCDSKEEARKILQQYMTFTKQPLDVEEGLLLIKDRFNGDVAVKWSDSRIAGFFSENGDSIDLNGFAARYFQ